MKYFCKIFFIFILISINEKSRANFENKIVVKVENEIISSFEIKNRILTALYFSGEEINQKNINKYKKEILNSLIENKLKKIESKNYNMIPNEQRVKAYLKERSSSIQELKKNFIVNNIDFELYLEHLNNEFMWQDLIFKLYSNKITVDENLIEQKIKNYLKQNSQIEEFKISKIDLELNKKDKINEKIIELQTSIEKLGFEQTAIIFNNEISSDSVGNLGWISSNALSPDIFDIVKKLEIGNVSKPIKKGNNLIILKLNDKKTSKREDLDINLLKRNFSNQRRNEQLSLYSRSHLSKLKNNTLIEYK